MKCFNHSFHSKETATQHRRGLEALEMVCVGDSEKSGKNGWKSPTSACKWSFVDGSDGS